MELEKTKEIAIKAIDDNLNPEMALSLKNTFMPFFEQAEEWAKKAKEINITDVTQIKEMQLARDTRLNLRTIRINVEKTRKELKEESLRKGKAIDGIANVIKFLIVPIEEHLQEQENFVIIQEEKRKSELKESREKELEQYARTHNRAPMDPTMRTFHEDRERGRAPTWFDRDEQPLRVAAGEGLSVRTLTDRSNRT